MANDINIDILINAGQASKTLKEQREALLAINDALGKVKQGSGAFELLTEEAQRLTKSMGVLNTTFEDVYGDLQPLTTRLGELEDKMYELALAGKQNTDEFKQIQAEAIKMRKTIIDVDSSVDAFAQKGAKLNALVGVVGGITSAFGLAQGAAALFGEEGKAIEETLVKVNSVMLILNSLSEIQRLITEKNIIVQGILNTVMKANPIFILLGVITAVIGGIKLFISATEDATDAQRDLNDQLEYQQTILLNNNEQLVKEAEARISLAEAQGKSEKELLKLRLDLIDTQQKTDKDAYDSAVNRIKQLQRERTDADDERRTQITNEISEQQKIKDAYLDKNKKIAGSDNFYAFQKKLLLEKQRTDEKKTQEGIRAEQQRTAEQRAKDLENFKKERQEYLRLMSENSDNLIKMERDLAFEIELLNTNEIAKELKMADKKYNDDIELLQDKQDEEIRVLDEKYNKKLISKDEYEDAKYRIEVNYGELSNRLTDKLELDKENIYKKSFDKLLELQNDNKAKTYQLKMEELDNELKLKRENIKKQKEANKELTEDGKKDLQKQTENLDKTIQDQNKLLTKREAERADAVRMMNETRSTEEREVYQSVINDIDALQLKTKEEIKTNTDLLNEKKKQLELNEKLYGKTPQQEREEQQQEELDILAQKKKLAEDYYNSTLNFLTGEYEANKFTLDEQIKKSKENINISKEVVDGYNDVVNVQNKVKDVIKTTPIDEINNKITELTNSLSTASEEEKAIIEDTILVYQVARDNITEYGIQKAQEEVDATIDIYTKKADEEKNFANTEKLTLDKLVLDKKKLELDYNKDVIDLAKNTTEKVNTEAENITTKNKEELDKRRADWENFVQQAIVGTIGLLNAALDAGVEGRIANIQRESELRLEAIEAEKQAYLDSVTEQTNAEKFRALKLKEFEDKKLQEQKKRDREIAIAQYNGELRKWEFSRVEALVNLSNALLKAAPNPFLLATTAALGVVELATITANKPTQPRFARGGVLDGPSHAQGGINTPFGEMEGGEAVINKKSTKMFLPVLSQINEAGGGIPFINTPKMANGGITNNINIDNAELIKIMEEWTKKPIKTYVVSTDVTNAQNKDGQINRRTSF